MLHAILAFTGAFLLFFLQPFLGKAITPLFGGGTQVWITCMLFFQAVLLAGYGYAHLLASRSAPTFQVKLHGSLLLLSLGWLFFQAFRWGNPWVPGGAVAVSSIGVLVLLLKGAGLPMAVLSASSPLIQAWYGNRFPGRNPYWLYAASNAGSVAGLLSYPFAAERWLSLAAQGRLALGILVLLALLLTWAGTDMARRAPRQVPVEDAGPRPSTRDAWSWLGLSALGSALLVAATNLLGDEVATLPLLWVLPLLAYLASFIAVFQSRRPWPPHVRLAWWLPALAGSGFMATQGANLSGSFMVAAGCTGAVLFGCLACHAFLFDLRPRTEDLTAFYLVMALGGVLGGAAVALGAPLLLDRHYEFGLCCLGVGAAAVLWMGSAGSLGKGWVWVPACIALLASGWTLRQEAARPGSFYRDFFGVVQVATYGDFMVLKHGRTVHGAGYLHDARYPLAYYGRSSGIGRALRLVQSRKGAVRVGVVGLGAGSAVLYGRPSDDFTFYEISPKVIALAGRNPKAFPFLRDAPCTVRVLEGDGRTLLDAELRRGAPQGFDLLMVDAFSGGAVPWHLLTVEAFQTYLGHLAPDGILALHVSNSLAVDRVAITSGQFLGLHMAGVSHPGRPVPGALLDVADIPSTYLLLARRRAVLDDPIIAGSARFLAGPGYFSGTGKLLRLPVLPRSLPWRDGRSSLSDLLFQGPAF